MLTKFALGQIVATPAALSMLRFRNQSAETFLARHAECDWGDLCEEDKKENDDAVKNGNRIMSSYSITPIDKIWIITEHDRSVTTLLCPEDY